MKIVRRLQISIPILLCSITSCSLSYIDSVRTGPSELSYSTINGLTRELMHSRFGQPVESSVSSEVFKIRGRSMYSNVSNIEMASAVPFLMMGLIVPGVIFDLAIFPYVFIDESYGAIADSFCIEVTYDEDDQVIVDKNNSAFRIREKC